MPASTMAAQEVHQAVDGCRGSKVKTAANVNNFSNMVAPPEGKIRRRQWNYVLKSQGQGAGAPGLCTASPHNRPRNINHSMWLTTYYAGNPPVRFKVAGAGDGVMESLNGREAGNGGHSQGASCTPPRRSPTQLHTAMVGLPAIAGCSAFPPRSVRRFGSSLARAFALLLCGGCSITLGHR